MTNNDFFFRSIDQSIGKSNTPEPNITLDRMTKLMTENLSSSQLDLVIHGPGEPTAPGHCKPNQYDNVNNAFIESEKGKKSTEVSSFSKHPQ